MCPALWIPAYAGMTVRDAWNDGPARTLPLWIADQVRNDGYGVLVCVDSRLRGNDGRFC